MAIAAKHRATVLGVTIIAVLVLLSSWAFTIKAKHQTSPKTIR